MKTTYSEGFIEQALVKVFSRGKRTIGSIAEELNINPHTLKNWLDKKSMEKRTVSAKPEKRPQDWRAEEQLLALQESYGLTDKALNAWCRERGLFAHHLTVWKAAFCVVDKIGFSGTCPPLPVKLGNPLLALSL